MCWELRNWIPCRCMHPERSPCVPQELLALSCNGDFLINREVLSMARRGWKAEGLRRGYLEHCAAGKDKERAVLQLLAHTCSQVSNYITLGLSASPSGLTWTWASFLSAAPPPSPELLPLPCFCFLALPLPQLLPIIGKTAAITGNLYTRLCILMSVLCDYSLRC